MATWTQCFALVLELTIACKGERYEGRKVRKFERDSGGQRALGKIRYIEYGGTLACICKGYLVLSTNFRLAKSRQPAHSQGTTSQSAMNTALCQSLPSSLVIVRSPILSLPHKRPATPKATPAIAPIPKTAVGAVPAPELVEVDVAAPSWLVTLLTAAPKPFSFRMLNSAAYTEEKYDWN